MTKTEIDTRVKFIQALRDFFLSTKGEEMHKALEKLEFYDKYTDIPASSERLLKLEYAFNRLFVGPDKVLAPPYASIYLDNEPQLQGKSTEAINKILFELNLDFTNPSKVSSDFISIELEIWLVLSGVLETARNKLKSFDPQAEQTKLYHEMLDNMQKTYDWLCYEHMGKWIEEFIHRIEKAPEEIEKLKEKVNKDDILMEEILFVCECLKAWVKCYASK